MRDKPFGEPMNVHIRRRLYLHLHNLYYHLLSGRLRAHLYNRLGERVRDRICNRLDDRIYVRLRKQM